MNKKRFTGILLGLALMLGLMTGLSLTAQAETWSSSFTTDGGTVDGGVTVSANIELSIPKGVTLRVNGGIDATGHTLTVIGAGRLVVNGINGSFGSNGRDGGGSGENGTDGSAGFKGTLIVDGASVTVNGGDGGKGGKGGDGHYGHIGGSGGNGGNGGNGVFGDVTVKSGSFTAKGGNGGNGGDGGSGWCAIADDGGDGGNGGNGGSGGNGVTGKVTVEGGSATVTGGIGGWFDLMDGFDDSHYFIGGRRGDAGIGSGGVGDPGSHGDTGDPGAAVGGTITGATSAKESDDNTNWTTISGGTTSSGGSSDKQYVCVIGPHKHSFTYAAGTGDKANTITAACLGGEDCPITTGLEMTISKPTALTYDGTEKAATLNTDYNTTAFPDTYAISYTKDGADFSETPTDVGDYTASVTVGSGVRAATVIVSYTIDPITISSVAVDIEAPVATAALAATATTADHVTLGALSWQPADTNAGYATAYTASVTATANANYAFADGVTATVNGNDVTPAKNQDGTLGVSYTFPATKQNPLTAAPVDQAVDYSPDGIAIPVEGMFNIADGAGAATYAVTGGTGAGTWDAQAGRLAVLKCGTFTVSVSTAESTTHAAGAEISATLTVNRVAPAVTAPTPRGLTYSGQAQALVDAGSTDNGTLYYAVTENDKAPAENLYDTAIPTGADIGTYYVWYRVVGDANHTNTDPFPLAVTIYPVDREALKTAIARAGDYYDSIRDKAQYADIAAGLESAISAAGTVAGNDKATESDIAGAISGVIDALVKAVQDVAAVDKQIADEEAMKQRAEEAAKQQAEEAARKQAADQAAADAVTQKINALPDEAGVNDREAVAAARAVFDALTDDQQALVPKVAQDRLAAAEAQVRATEEAADAAAKQRQAADEAAKKQQAADQAAADAVTKTIRALPAEAGVNDKAAVAAARAAYDALTNDQKALVPYDALSRLAAAEAQVRAAEEAADAAAKQQQAAEEAEDEAAKKQAADQAAANIVIKKIKALPDEAGLGDRDAVKAARKAYDALTDDQKALVPYDVLGRLAAAEAQVRAAESDGQPIHLTNFKFTVKDRTYTGKPVRKPAVTVMYGKLKLEEGTDYTVTYDKKAKEIGAYKLEIKGIGNYTGTKTLAFKVVPKGTAFTKLTGGNRRIALKWKKQKNITGYQIQYSLVSDFSVGRKVTVRKAKTLSTIIKELKAGKKYYVRIRTYAKIDGEKYYSSWSKTRTVNTKGAKGNDAGLDIGFEGIELGEDLELPAIDDVDDGGLVLDEEEIGIVME